MFLENLDSFFPDFGEEITLVSQARTITGIIDAPTEPALLGKIEAQLCKMVLTCKSSDVADVFEGHAITVRGAVHRVSRVDPDGSGITLIGVVEESVEQPAQGSWR